MSPQGPRNAQATEPLAHALNGRSAHDRGAASSPQSEAPRRRPMVKQILNFDGDLYADLVREAARQGCAVSWLVRGAWKMARAEVRRFPGRPR